MALLVEYTEPQWRNLNMRSLQVDEAYVYVKSFFNEPTYLYSLYEKCYTCPFTKEKAIPAYETDQQHSNDALKFDVSRGLQLIVLDKDVGPYAFDKQSLCSLKLNDLHEFGVYNLSVATNGTCSFVTDKEGVSVNFAFLTVFMIITMFLVLLKLVNYFYKRYDEVGNDETPTTSTATVPKEINKRKRMKSLDGFRGMAIVLMIFVNSGGGKYWWMEHAIWNGLHVADMVFPSFLWIMGVCIPISIKVQLTRGSTKAQVCKKIIWRSIKLFFIGLCLNSLNGPQFNNLRIMGVLQRFGIAYLVCGLIHTIFCKNDYTAPPQSRWRSIFYEVFAMKAEFLAIFSLIVLYFGIVFGLKVPGCPKGYLGPGGKDNYGSYPKCVMGGATGYIDLKVLGSSHVYQYPTAKNVYNSTAFDPEGIFGCCMTIVQVFFGILAGVIILAHSEWQVRLKRWFCWSLVLGIIGGSIAGFSRETGWIPVNKNLWSLSFVFVTVSLAFCILSLMYYIIDIREWWNGYPFVECGMNAIVMYVGHTIMHKMLPWHWRIGSMNTHFILLFEATWNTMLWVFIALYLDSIHCYYTI